MPTYDMSIVVKKFHTQPLCAALPKRSGANVSISLASARVLAKNLSLAENILAFSRAMGWKAFCRAATEELGERPVYLTVDIDVVDPAFAPGTGTPEPGGWTSSELFDALHAIRDLNVIGCDLVEVCPAAEHGVVTSILGAKVVREMLLAFGFPSPQRVRS